MRPPTARRAVVLVALALGVFSAGLASPLQADPEVAEFLLGEGKKAVSHRDYAKAIQRFTRALEEDPELLEAAYLLGTTHEKAGEPGAALAAFRAFRDGCLARQKDGELDRKHKSWLRRAESRIKVLGKGEAELDKLRAAFEKRILAFARKNETDDPDIAAHALRQLLSVERENEKAQELLEAIVGRDDLTLPGGEVDDEAVPIAGIRIWDDILKRKAHPAGDSVSYRRGLMVLDQQGGSIYWLDGRTKAPGVFVYETEFRVTKDYAAGWAVGLAFANKPGELTKSREDEMVTAFLQKTVAHLVKVVGRRNQDVADATIDPIKMEKWVRLTVAVEGRKVRVFVDGRMVLQSSIPAVTDLSGGVGIFHQRCLAELRLHRLGTKS